MLLPCLKPLVDSHNTQKISTSYPWSLKILGHLTPAFPSDANLLSPVSHLLH